VSRILAEVKVATKNKVPLVRASCLTWVANSIESSNKATVLKLHKDYVPISMEVRTSWMCVLDVRSVPDDFNQQLSFSQLRRNVLTIVVLTYLTLEL
jgi:hypothetical protein